MPERRLQGLRGLKGLNTLSPEERETFMQANANKLSIYKNPMKRRQAANILYMNQKYINTFGLDDFNLNNDGTEESFNMRNDKTKLITDAFLNTFGKEDNINELATYLDVDGMYDLLNNEEYLGKTKIRNKFIKNINDSKAMQKAYDSSLNIPYAEAALAKGIIRTKTVMNPYEQRKKDEQRDKEILDRLYAESQKRREKCNWSG